MRNFLSEIFAQALPKPALHKCRFVAKELQDRPKPRKALKTKKGRRKMIQASRRHNR